MDDGPVSGDARRCVGATRPLRSVPAAWLPPPQVVTDDMWESRFDRFPLHPPRTREYYLLRSIFETHFPHPDAIKTVPQGLSIACSTPEALKWDPAWEGSHEISGRAILSVHEAGAGFRPEDGVPTAAAAAVANGVH